MALVTARPSAMVFCSSSKGDGLGDQERQLSKSARVGIQLVPRMALRVGMQVPCEVSMTVQKPTVEVTGPEAEGRREIS